MEPATNNDNFNEDELVAPDWLNAEFFEEVLSKHEKDPELKVLDVKMSPASGKGDHYASVMFRGNVEYTTPKGKFSKSLIVKTMPEQEGHKKDMLNGSYIFDTEINMYTKALPKFEEILREAGDETKLCVPCIYHSLEPRQLMIFEDLLPQGYGVIRGRGPSIDELKAAFSKLAKWQAVSFKILNENPDNLKEFKNSVASMPNFMDNKFITSGDKNFLEFLDKTPELTKYKPYFEKRGNEFLLKFQEVLEEYRANRQPNNYYVLSHGDFNDRNMMFKHNKTTGALEDCMLIDFQMSNVCPITADVLYSIYMLMGSNERRNNHKELLDFYFSNFVETLQKIGFQGELPKVVDFWQQIFNHKDYEMFFLQTFLPMMFAVRSNRYSFDDMMENEEVSKKVYFLDAYVEDAKYLLSRYEQNGYFK